MNSTLNKHNIIWIEFRPISGIATKADCEKMGIGWRHPIQYNGYAYEHFSGKEVLIYYLRLLQFDRYRKKLSKKYEVRLFSDAQFRSMDMRKKEKGKGYPVEFTDKQNEIIITIE